ncbi:MAG: dephospho-CoA kinase [Tenacibaculum sp.]
MIVGLTGGIGSGKTTVAKIFASCKNVAVYNADIEAKKLMNNSSTIKTKLINEFGKEVLKNRRVNSAYLANIVFKNKEKLLTLNKIVHPVVYEHLKKFIASNKKRLYTVYENAILFENKSWAYCNKIITVTAPLELKIQRVIKRDKTTSEEVKNRIKNQWCDAKKIIQSHYLINNLEIVNTKKQVLKIHETLKNTIAQCKRFIS